MKHHIWLTPKGIFIKQKIEVIEREFLDILLEEFDKEEIKIFEKNIDKAFKNRVKRL
jgi:DNA-binding MarR family transcriptional regulator